MFTTCPLFGKFHSPLNDAGLALRRHPLHHLESLCAQRIDPMLLQPQNSASAGFQTDTNLKTIFSLVPGKMVSVALSSSAILSAS